MQSITIVHLPFTALVLLVMVYISIFKNSPFVILVGFEEVTKAKSVWGGVRGEGSTPAIPKQYFLLKCFKLQFLQTKMKTIIPLRVDKKIK